MMRKDAGERREISLDGGKTSGNRTMSQAAKADVVQGEVGRPRSSEEASVMGAERRGSSCVRAKEASGERGDGSRDLPTPDLSSKSWTFFGS